MNADDLKKYCGADYSRSYTHQPFSLGDYTYATNGIVVVRVARLTDVPARDDVPPIEKLFSENMATNFRPLRSFSIPPEKKASVACPDCCGSGHEHECPDCDCECEACDGKGTINRETQVSVGVNGAAFDAKVFRLICDLPGIAIQDDAPSDKRKPVAFRFDGGDGVMMPMSFPHNQHIEEPAA